MFVADILDVTREEDVSEIWGIRSLMSTFRSIGNTIKVIHNARGFWGSCAKDTTTGISSLLPCVRKMVLIFTIQIRDNHVLRLFCYNVSVHYEWDSVWKLCDTFALISPQSVMWKSQTAVLFHAAYKRREDFMSECIFCRPEKRFIQSRVH